ncbi:MAG: ABC transporter permease [Clostridia bacterium]|nr:ABC transporter permease [Clostridia bacterium]
MIKWFRIRSIVVKEIIQIKRDIPSLAIIFIMPVFMLLLFGYAVTTDVDHITTVVWDQDKSPQSREIIQAFEQSGYFDIRYYAGDMKEITWLIDGGEAKAGFIIPPGYARDVLKGQSAGLQAIIDGSDPLIARTALSTAQMIGQVKGFALKLESLSRFGLGIKAEPGIDLRARVWYNPDMESVRFNVPGLIGLIMQNITVMLTAFALVKERERGTMEQLIITPIKPFELIIGKLIPYVGIGFMDVIVTLLIGSLWFEVPVNGSVLLLLALSLVFLLVALGLGLFISTVAKTQLQAMQMTFMIILPSVLLSGFMFPREAMPLPVQAFGAVIPLTYFLEILRGIILKGIGLQELWRNVLWLAILGVGILTLSAVRFKKKLD